MSRAAWWLGVGSLIAHFTAPIDAQTAGAGDVDASTLRGKVICGYQGWFRCPGDASNQGWRHWSRDGRTISPRSLTFEMWPDLSEYGADERYPAPGFTNPDGSAAELFSSVNGATVGRHFLWMKEHGIDGVFLQRFLVNTRDPSFDTVIEHVRAAVSETGRVYAICYDMTGIPDRRLYETIESDWKRLVDELKVTSDARYLRHDGRPVVFVWGFYPDRFDAALANRVIDLFQTDGPYRATLIGGCPWYWRNEKDPEWARALRRFDVISPWNVGNAMKVDGVMEASTRSWADDMAEAKRAGMEYLPVIYPGFGWINLMGPESARATLPRRRGEFFWRQFVTARELRVEMAYVAMFDEVDEATAIFKVTNQPPTPGTFQTYEGLPSDWYLRLAGEGTRMLRGDRELTRTIPIKP